jgi:hypothetical protein
MLLAVVLLVAGGAMMFFAPDGAGTLHTVGLGIVTLAGVVYLVARVAQWWKERRR